MCVLERIVVHTRDCSFLGLVSLVSCLSLISLLFDLLILVCGFIALHSLWTCAAEAQGSPSTMSAGR